jgi:uroporphyrin-III C-methyltransferase
MEPQPTLSLEETEVKTQKNKYYKGYFIAWCAMGLLLITCIGLFLGLSFFWLKNNEKLSLYHYQLAIIKAQVSQNQMENKKLQQYIIALQNFIAKKISTDDNAIWLTNVNQLIQLAQYNLSYFHDTDNALSALILADKQLAAIIKPDTRLEKIRQLLTQNLTQLKTLPHSNLSNILIQLQTLKMQISQLPLLAKNNSIVPNSNSVASHSSENKWLSMLKNSLNNFRNLVIIRRWNKPIEPLLPEKELQFLQHNLLLLLQQAQWALIHHEAAIYQASLQEILETIKDHFSPDASITQTAIQNINQLKQIDLQTPALDLNPLLEVILNIQKTRNDPNFTITTANQKEAS